MCHFRCPWNGMFDCHRVKITVMQFTGHSLPVHLFVAVPRDFNPVPYCQPSSPTPMEYALPPSLEWHVWRGRRAIYNKGKQKMQKNKLCSFVLIGNKHQIETKSTQRGCPRGVMVKAVDCGIVVREFVLQSRYYIHFWANTLGKGMNPLILPAMG